MTFGKSATINFMTFHNNNGQYLFQTMTENRKRSREDDTCEFMPLSKRINNLHINNGLVNTSVPQTQDSSQLSSIVPDNSMSSPGSSSDSMDNRRPSYDPGIASSQSNYYYDNKLLFELHLERIQRSGQQYPF